jgi:hypothetical protein
MINKNKSISTKDKILQLKYITIRLFLIFLPLIFCGSTSVSAYSNANVSRVTKNKSLYTAAAPLVGGCITSGNQSVVIGNIPATIVATAATLGSCGTSYLYQWQSSTDSIYFYNVAGASSLNLSFSATLPQTTWFQRKTTCATEVRYTTPVKVTMTPGT